MESPQIFLSYAGADAFEASLLQRCIENLLSDIGARVWAYKRDQPGNERNIGRSLKERVRESSVVIMLVSQFTLSSSITQWMELAYADAFDVPTFVLLHHLSFDDLKHSERGIPPLIIEGQCTPAIDWPLLESDLRRYCVTNDTTIVSTGTVPEGQAKDVSETRSQS